MTTHRLDARGLQCPLPVLRARKALKALADGDMLEVEATDPGSVRDMSAFCDATGYRLLSWREEKGIYHFQIEKTASGQSSDAGNPDPQPLV